MKKGVIEVSEDIWNILFREFENFNRRMDEMLSGFDDLSGPDVRTYGYTMYRGPDGVAHVKEFGNAAGELGLPSADTVREPFTDVTREGDVVRVVAEVPGAKKEDIVLDATSDSLSISVDAGNKKYRKTVALPCEVDIGSAKAEYNNGILEVSFRSEDEMKSGRRIEVD
jgi:HSP20 family protein